MSALFALLASTGSQLFAKIGKHLEELQVLKEDLKTMSLAELIEEADFEALGIKDPIRREFVLNKVERLIKKNEVSDSKYIKYTFDNTKSDLFVKIGRHLYDLQVSTDDIQSIEDLKKFISMEDLQSFGITSEDKSNFVFKKAFDLITKLKENLPEMDKQSMALSPNFGSSDVPVGSMPALMHLRQPSRKFTLSGPVDARSFWRFYFGQQDKVTHGQMEGAIVSLMESLHDNNRISDENIQCIIAAIVSQHKKTDDNMIHKDTFYTFIETFYKDNVTRSFIQLQDEFIELQKIDTNKDLTAVTTQNAEMYLLYASKYSQLLTQKNFAQTIWTHVIVTEYLTSLEAVMQLADKFEKTHQKDIGTQTLQREIFSNRSRMESLLSSSTSAFYTLSEQNMKRVLCNDQLAINEETLFDGVIEWSKRVFAREKEQNDHGKKNRHDNHDSKYPFESWKERIRNVLPYIRFPIMEDEYILKTVLPNRDIFENKDHLLYILSFHLSDGDVSLLKDLPYPTQLRGANGNKNTDKNQSRLEKLRGENNSLRKTVSTLNSKITQLETQLRRTSGLSQSNVFGLDAKSKSNSKSNVESNHKSESVSAGLKKRNSGLAKANELTVNNSNPTPARLLTAPTHPPVGTHREDNNTFETTIEHDDVVAPEDTLTSSSDEEETSEAQDPQIKKSSSQKIQRKKEEPEEEIENGTKTQPKHWGQVSISNTLVEGEGAAQFTVGFRRLNNFNEAENKIADQMYEDLKQKMEARLSGLKKSKSKPEDYTGDIAMLDDTDQKSPNDPATPEISLTRTLSPSSLEKKVVSKKKLLEVSSLESPLFKEILTVGAIKYSSLEEKKLEELNLALSDIVTISLDRTGVVRYIGEAHFFWGTVIGIELLKNSKGKNSGHIDGIKYFDCKPGKGLFIKPMAILKVEKPKQRLKVKTPNRTSEKKPTKANLQGRRMSEMASLRRSEEAIKLLKKNSEPPEKEKITSPPVVATPREWPGKFKLKAEQERMDRLGIDVGDCVQLSKGERAVITYIGVTNSSKGLVHFGIELMDGALGSCSGEMNGERYFECEEKRGEFIYSDRIRKKVDFLKDLPEW